MDISDYLESVGVRFAAGNATEHSYRGDLQRFLEANLDGVHVTNEPKRIDCGAPDYILTRNGVPLGYIEAKNVGSDLRGKAYEEQFDRYRSALPNLIITDYLDFHFYRDGEIVAESRIADVSGGIVVPSESNFDAFSRLILDFVAYHGQTIRAASTLAKMMANKARLMADILGNAVEDDVKNEANTELHQQLKAFQSVLIHDIDERSFADIYSQTIAYGMFAARLHDPTLEDFSRQEAAGLIPKTNPLLRKLFYNIAGPDLDTRIDWIVDALVEIYRATDVASLLKDFGKVTQRSDPFIHFYETFLAEYDPRLRRSRGVWYTPEPVVNFIVRAVDHILEEDFRLQGGLSNSSKITVSSKTDQPDRRTKSGYVEVKKDVHRVQVLDPATGTGTFLSEVVKRVHSRFEGQEGIWPQYAADELVPRLHGFELLMASYAIAHMKLEMVLEETGYSMDPAGRLQVYLTNSLEEYHPDTGTLFASWLSSEAAEANHIKRDCPIMVVIGNPPYSAASTNKGKWIVDLIDQYKFVDGEHFGERKHWLNDDYVKFIRYGQHFIEKNGEGILAYITNHGFLDNTTFRGMRWNLLNCFDDIYILDLHGNSMKNEVAPDGSDDVNVFDIQVGVSINVFVKRSGKASSTELANVYHVDVWGSREEKYDYLWNSSLDSVAFSQINCSAPYFFFKPKQFEQADAYNAGFKLTDLFREYVSGIVTMGDGFIVAPSAEELEQRITDFLANDVSEEQLKREFRLGKNYARWALENKASLEFDRSKIVQIDYRPFDKRYTYFDNKLIWRWREAVMKNMLAGPNVALLCCRQSAVDSWEHVSVTDCISDDSRVSNRTKERGYIFPLYVYADEDRQEDMLDSPEPLKKSNLNEEIVQAIGDRLQLEFVEGVEPSCSSFSPQQLFDYIYAVLHSAQYRETYFEFLKVDFPKIPLPPDKERFRRLASIGESLRRTHFLLDIEIRDFLTTYPRPGDNRITRTINDRCFEVVDDERDIGRLWINDQQYFDGVPLSAWEHQSGGYRPAEKWLKDRKGSVLSPEDVIKFQKIVVALTRTDQAIREVDSVFTV